MRRHEIMDGGAGCSVPTFRVLTRSASSNDKRVPLDPLSFPISSSSSASASSNSNSNSNSGFANPPSAKFPVPSVASPSSSSAGGVAVVGAVGRNAESVTQLLNRLLDSHIFGSGNKDVHIRQGFTDVAVELPANSYKHHQHITYYVDEERATVYLQFAWGSPHLERAITQLSNSIPHEYRTVLDQHETDALHGLLFMFSVCHVIIFVHEGVRFETQLLKTFRTLQAAKHSLVPFVKSQILPGLLPVPTPGTGSKVTTNSRATSAIKGISGSSTNLLPGQCTPVLLFAVLDDFPETSSSTSNSFNSHSTESPVNPQGISAQQGPGILHIPGPGLQSKVSNPVVMLARPAGKLEGGFRKRLQTSLEAQIRFLIKKCRIIAGGGDGGTATSSGHGPRGPGSAVSMSAGGAVGPLFTLDASKAIALIDRSSNRKSHSLNAALEEILLGKEFLESLLLENNSHTGVTEDILSIKEFLSRQIDALRGRGGISVNSAGTSVGVGMVAAAAAAAAASAAAGGAGTSMKSYSSPPPPELPSITSWQAACCILYDLLIEGRICNTFDNELNRGFLEGSASFQMIETCKAQVPLQTILSCLEVGRGLDMKFSAAWCKRALPSAKELYLKGLPPSYPTVVHKTHLEKALHAFQSMVRGPAVQSFRDKLKDNCEAIWKSGRQLCDAVSLTGKPCVHPIHEVPETSSPSDKKFNARPHASSFVFLHACACGRSRRLRNDPFDFESANVKFSHFPNCEDNLPSLSIPFSNNGDPMGGAAWSLLRLGGIKYYDVSVGLQQSGFCVNENFLFKWTFSHVLEDPPHAGLDNILKEDFKTPYSTTQYSEHIGVSVDDKTALNSVSVVDVSLDTQVPVKGKLGKPLERRPDDDPKTSISKGFPVPEMKKPFAEVVAKSNSTTDSAFPPLQQKKQQHGNSDKIVKQKGGKEKKDQMPHAVIEDTNVIQSKSTAFEKIVEMPTVDGREEQADFLLGHKTVTAASQKTNRAQPSLRFKHITFYIGFEHECSYGHRFFLSLEQLEKLGPPYSDYVKNVGKKGPDQQTYILKEDKQGAKQSQLQNKPNYRDDKRLKGAHETILNQTVTSIGKASNLPNNDFMCDGRNAVVTFLNEGEGPGFSLVNMNLPVYMHCPHCHHSGRSDREHTPKFASTISQLQRIFMVTPPFPTILASSPVIQFEKLHLPHELQKSEKSHRFSLGSKIILPPESFVSLKLPFVYGERLDDGSLVPLLPHPNEPELTAWIVKGTTLQLLSNGQESDNVHHS